MSAVRVYALMDDNAEYLGEYIGAQDGYAFLSTEDGVVRLEQKRIAGWAMVVASDEEDAE
jgi:hypothetical protein